MLLFDLLLNNGHYKIKQTCFDSNTMLMFILYAQVAEKKQQRDYINNHALRQKFKAGLTKVYLYQIWA